MSFTPYINGKNGFTQQEISQFYPSVWTDGLVNGQRHRMLVDTKVFELFHNKNVFQQAGITAVPATYAQLAQDLAIIKQKVPAGREATKTRQEPPMTARYPGPLSRQ